MEQPKIYVHGSYVGNTGYNQHTRDFFRHMSEYSKIKVRNFTVGSMWDGYNLTPHDKEPYINDIDKKLLYKQILWNNDGSRGDYPIYENPEKEFVQDVDIVLCETNHYLFYDNYKGPKIAYNVWESTLQPLDFFNKILDFDEFWVPSKWQKEVTIAQGYPENKIKVVPEGVDINTFFPEDVKYELTNNGRFTFFLAGRWDYRKSIKDIIETFLKTFDKNEPVDLIVSIDNPFSNDGLKSTEERLDYYRLKDDRIKVLHFPPREDYVKLMKSANVFVSCARSEGWNLPLIESMACGTVSIYSNCSGQLEFAEGKGLPVNILYEKPVSEGTGNHFNTSIGNYYEPDFNHLSTQMRNAYENYDFHKNKALKDSEIIRQDFSWDNVAKIGIETINDFLFRKPWLDRPKNENVINISYIDGPRVEVTGDEDKEYFVEFIDSDTNKILHSSTIKNNMWTSCSIKYFKKWQIRINGDIIDNFNLNEKRVLISFESRSIGDTIAWIPYTIEFAKKHNCKVIVSTFHNNWFEGKEEYKDIEFIVPGSIVDCHTVYRIGWFKKDNKWTDFEKYPNQINLIPLQQAATDILGLEYKELNYGLNIPNGNRPIENKYVAFGPNATSGCKEWDYNYWVILSKMIKELGYDVITLTEKPYHIDGVKNIWGIQLKDVANYLNHAEAFIGLGSGLSWFNWALNNHTYMINGFSKEGHEFSTNITKIFNYGVCISCWNDSEFVFDSGDWDWCPVYKGTQKQHICQRSITPLQVFNTLNL